MSYSLKKTGFYRTMSSLLENYILPNQYANETELYLFNLMHNLHPVPPHSNNTNYTVPSMTIYFSACESGVLVTSLQTQDGPIITDERKDVTVQSSHVTLSSMDREYVSYKLTLSANQTGQFNTTV